MSTCVALFQWIASTWFLSVPIVELREVCAAEEEEEKDEDEEEAEGCAASCWCIFMSTLCIMTIHE